MFRFRCDAKKETLTASSSAASFPLITILGVERLFLLLLLPPKRLIRCQNTISEPFTFASRSQTPFSFRLRSRRAHNSVFILFISIYIRKVGILSAAQIDSIPTYTYTILRIRLGGKCLASVSVARFGVCVNVDGKCVCGGE